MSHALGIDVGTTNVKVTLVRDDGTVVASSSEALTTRTDGPTSEQDAAALWAAVCVAVRFVTGSAPHAAADVAHVGVCSQYSSIVGVDAVGEPVTPLVLYLDERGTDPSWAIMAEHEDAFEIWIERHGIPPIGSGLSLGHLLALQADAASHSRVATYLEPMDFVNLRLTGRLAANQCTVFAGQLTDNRTLGTTSYDDDLIQLSGIDLDRLPPLLGIQEPVGPLRSEVAAELGLPATAIVQAAMNDSHAGAFATGAYSPGQGGIVIGTTAVMLDTLDRMDLDIDHELVSMPSPVPGTYLAMAENGMAGKVVEHILEKVVYAADELGHHLSDDQFARLDAALSSVPAGANNVLFLPWLSGSMAPKVDRGMRGGFLNMSLETDRATLVRATVEGVCRNLRWLQPFVMAFTGSTPERYVLGGGAARSAEWCRMLADILDTPVHPLLAPDVAASRATAMVALHNAGELSAGDLTAMVVTADPFEPIASNRALHDVLQDQFEASYAAMQPICEALNP